MKKLSVILLTIALTGSLIAGCSRNKENNTPNDNNTNQNATEITNVPNNNNTNVNDNTATNDTQNNENANNTGNTDNTNKNQVTVTAIADAIKAAYGENYLPNVEITPELLESEFGLTSDMYVEVKAEQPMIGTHADRVVVVKAAEGRADDVEAALNAAKETKINDTFQYPMNLPKINAAKIVRNGDFVCFLLVGAYNENENATEEEAKKFAEDEVAKGVNAFNNLFK